MLGVTIHEFICRHHAIGVHARAQGLRNDGDQVVGKLHANLFLLIGWEGVDDAVDRAGGTAGVQRAEDQVPGFGGGDGGADRRQVAHFADQDHVRILSQRAAKGFGVARQGEPEQPRIMLVSVPFALKAGDAETLGGKPPSAYALAPALGSSLPAIETPNKPDERRCGRRERARA